jgi:hypothetical protein
MRPSASVATWQKLDIPAAGALTRILVKATVLSCSTWK